MADFLHFSSDQIEFFHANGYVAGPRVLSNEQLDCLRERSDGILSGRIEYPDDLRGLSSAEVKGNLKLRKIANLFRNDRVFAEVIGNSAISTLAHDLMDAPVRVWEDQSIAKAPGDEFSVVAWHRDYTYWDHVGPPELATCWIALDDATIANGCMQVIPGSHLWNLDYTRDDIDNDNPDWVRERPEIPAEANVEPVACEVPAGHCHFHHCLTLHGSEGNTTDHPRRSYILHLMPGTTRRLGNDWNPRMASVEVVEVGQIVHGSEYPELPAVAERKA